MSLNQVVLVGRAGKDPELIATSSGSSVGKLTVATDDREKVNGEWQKVTEWHKVVCFGKLADLVAQYVHKGSLVSVVGRIKTRKYQDRDGNDRYSTEIVADTVKFLGGGSGERNSSGNGGGQDRGIPDDDLPF